MAGEPTKDPKHAEKIIAEFQILRKEQQNLINNLNTLELDLTEHKTVIATLKNVDEDRKCFRLIGGVLCERTVKEVLPQLIENQQFIEKTIKVVMDDVTKKGIQINKYKEDNNIRIGGEQIPTNDAQNLSREEQKIENRSNVLVSS